MAPGDDRRLILAVLLLAWASGAAGAAEAPDYAPLRLYGGAWRATVVDAKGAATTVVISNSCAQVGVNFACQQTVAGTPGSMIVFLPTAARGKWRTQNLSAKGEAGGGPGDLTIEGAVWTFLGQEKTAGGVTWTRNVNRFSGPDHIHFEIATSPDGQTWTPGISGDEVRAPRS